MRDKLEELRKKLIAGGYTCIISGEDMEYTSYERGVKPLITALESKIPYRSAIAADKTVGAGAAHLYVLLGVSALYAGIISEKAEQILKRRGIEVLYGERVPYIINRRGDGVCPIENAVQGIESSQEALKAIKIKLKELSGK